jgi:uncharacterized protein
MRIAEIYRYPVKSMLGESLDNALLGELGIPGDRAWALRDDVRGTLTGAKRFPQLMSMSARFAAEPDAAQRSPDVYMSHDGQTLSSRSSDVNEALSEVLEHPVSLWPLKPAEDIEHYRRLPPPEGTDMESALRTLFGRTEDEPVPDVSRFPEVLATSETPPGTYFDAYPLLIMTRASLTALADAAAQAGMTTRFDMRRFRPNLVIDTEAEGFVENAWIGRKLRLGDAIVNIEMECPRCIMTTHGFLDVPRDPKVMRALVQHNDGNLGVYATVSNGAAVCVGDTAELMD